ncbi:MAG TPA: chemotaxis protein CheD [Thermoanaerobaculia bacterium]|nr:chemotaxis protein CheD [Thermoanaerobaculia bacterium]
MTLNELLQSSGIPRGQSANLRNELAEDSSGSGRAKVYLHAGQLYASNRPTEIVTILGSCVSVCLFDASCGIGGLNHFMLPTDSITPSPRYLRHAMDMLLQQLTAFGARRSRLQAKLFGGASVLKSGETGMDLGGRNIEAARARLALEQIPIVAEDVGGDRGRKLVFVTSDGTALIKQV